MTVFNASASVVSDFFVSISYMCWAYRRQGIELGSENQIKKWLY